MVDALTLWALLMLIVLWTGCMAMAMAGFVTRMLHCHCPQPIPGSFTDNLVSRCQRCDRTLTLKHWQYTRFFIAAGSDNPDAGDRVRRIRTGSRYSGEATASRCRSNDD